MATIRGVLVELDALQSRALADEAAGNVWTAQRYADELDKLAAKKKLEILRMNPSRLN